MSAAIIEAIIEEIVEQMAAIQFLKSAGIIEEKSIFVVLVPKLLEIIEVLVFVPVLNLSAIVEELFFVLCLKLLETVGEIVEERPFVAVPCTELSDERQAIEKVNCKIL